jgi:hypothetical protein
VTEAIAEVPTEVVTEALTEAPTEALTEAPTEVVTEAPTEATTKAPVAKTKKERAQEFQDNATYSFGYDDYEGEFCADISFVNTTGKEIKYITFYVDYINRVGDISNDNKMKAEITGPIGVGETYEQVFTCSDADSATVDISFDYADIIYMDGTKETFNFTVVEK